MSEPPIGPPNTPPSVADAGTADNSPQARIAYCDTDVSFILSPIFVSLPGTALLRAGAILKEAECITRPRAMHSKAKQKLLNMLR
jgi:hypothetical protein